MTPTLHRLRWIAVPAILARAAVLRLWALDRPDSLVFDEPVSYTHLCLPVRFGSLSDATMALKPGKTLRVEDVLLEHVVQLLSLIHI